MKNSDDREAILQLDAGSRFSVLGSPFFIFFFVLCPLSFVLSLSPARAASPSEDLLRLVPDDVAFCLVIQDLHGHSAAFRESPFIEQFSTSPLGTALSKAPETRKLAELEKFLQEHLDINWAQIRDAILGDAVVLAYRPGPPGKPDQEQGLLLLRAREAPVLARLLDRLNAVQKQSGDLKDLEVREHNGQKYYRRVERKDSNYYYLRGPLLAFTSQEAVLQRAIDLDRQASKADDLPPVAQQLRRLGADKKLAALWINPRAFEAELLHKANAAQGAEAFFLKHFQAYWKVLEGVALFVSTEKDLEVGMAVRVRTEGLPAAARRLLAESSKPSPLWKCFPDDALLATAGRVDLTALVEMVGEFLTKETRQAIRDAVEHGAGAAFGKDVTTEILPYLGPDWGFSIAAPPPADKNWFPHAVWALRVRTDGKGQDVDRALLAGLNAFALLAVISHNSQHPDPLSLKTTTQDKVEVRYFVHEKGFPPGFQPAYALKGGYLVLASSPEAVRRFNPETAGSASGTSAEEVPILRLSFKVLRNYLRDRRETLITYATENKHVSKEEAGRKLDNLLTGLQLFDRLDLSQRSGPGQITLTLRLQTARPLRK